MKKRSDKPQPDDFAPMAAAMFAHGSRRTRQGWQAPENGLTYPGSSKLLRLSDLLLSLAPSCTQEEKLINSHELILSCVETFMVDMTEQVMGCPHPIWPLVQVQAVPLSSLLMDLRKQQRMFPVGELDGVSGLSLTQPSQPFGV